jgi:hypothetical protein
MRVRSPSATAAAACLGEGKYALRTTPRAWVAGQLNRARHRRVDRDPVAIASEPSDLSIAASGRTLEAFGSSTRLEAARTMAYPAGMPHQETKPVRVAVPPSPHRLSLVRMLFLALVLVGHLGFGFGVLAGDHAASGCDQAVLASPAAGGDIHSEAGCDHCCHASAHLLGIFTGDGAAGTPTLSAQFDTPGALSWLSHIASPPIRPPKPSA